MMITAPDQVNPASDHSHIPAARADGKSRTAAALLTREQAAFSMKYTQLLAGRTAASGSFFRNLRLWRCGP